MSDTVVSLTWESGFRCYSLNRRVSYVVVVNGGGQALKVRWTATLLRKALSQLTRPSGQDRIGRCL